MFRIAYFDTNGNFCICRPMQKYIDVLQKQGFSDESIKAHIIAKDVLPYAINGEYYELTQADLPVDRYYRNAWEPCPINKCKINREKAEDIHMNNLRIKRNEKLVKLDVDYIRAVESNDEVQKNEISAKKQQLRDMPQTEDLSRFSLEEMKEYIPEYL